MNNILSEKEYQKYILKKLAAIGYEVQPADHYNRLFAVSRQELMRFLETTQPDEMESLKKIYKEKTTTKHAMSKIMFDCLLDPEDNQPDIRFTYLQIGDGFNFLENILVRRRMRFSRAIWSE